MTAKGEKGAETGEDRRPKIVSLHRRVSQEEMARDLVVLDRLGVDGDGEAGEHALLRVLEEREGLVTAGASRHRSVGRLEIVHGTDGVVRGVDQVVRAACLNAESGDARGVGGPVGDRRELRVFVDLGKHGGIRAGVRGEEQGVEMGVVVGRWTPGEPFSKGRARPTDQFRHWADLAEVGCR